jgi:hypothetical protein
MQTSAILDAVVSHAQTTGHFENVNQYEAKSAPGRGIHCGVWSESAVALRNGSGLDSTSVRAIFTVQVLCSVDRDPQDDIDVDITNAVDALMTNYNGDFTLDGLIRNIDVFGQYGTPLGWVMGHTNISGKPFRVAAITLPLIIDDAWEQTA